VTSGSGDSFFTADGDWFRPTWCSRGPWDVDACHAGPPTGLMARASEIALPDHRLTRLMVDLTHPVPMAGLRVEVDVLRVGRSVATAEIRMIDVDERVVATARSLHLGVTHIGSPPSVGSPPPSLDDSEPGPFPLKVAFHGERGFFDSVECRYPPGEDPDPGPTTLWMRSVPLLPDEATSPFQRMCPLADCGNGISSNAEFGQHGSSGRALQTLLVSRIT
jgi:hypothetical protein